MEKYYRPRTRTWRVRIACWMTKVTHTPHTPHTHTPHSHTHHTHTHTVIQLSRSISSYTNAPQCNLVCPLPALFWLLTFQMCARHTLSFISVPSNAARHHGSAGLLRCEAVVSCAAVEGTFLWRCVYVSLRHCSCPAKRLVSVAVSRPDK